jgi:cell division protein FtsL
MYEFLIQNQLFIVLLIVLIALGGMLLYLFHLNRILIKLEKKLKRKKS